MPTLRLLATFGAAGLLAFAGCGGGESEDTPNRPAQPASGDAQKVFTSTCGGCHTLGAAGTDGKIGPNLDEEKPSTAEVLEAIKEGPSSMPENLLTGDQANEMAEYVAAAAGG